MIFKFLALNILFWLYFSYLMKSFLLKKQGIKAGQIRKGKKPKRTFVVEIFIQAFLFINMAVQVLSIFFSRYFLEIKVCNVARILGIVIGFLGVILFIVSVIHMKNSFRAGINEEEKTNLITSGVFKFSRNPIFFSFYLVYIGLCMAFLNVLILCTTVITILFFHLLILEEEKFLEKRFNKEYLEYKKKVRRYF